MMKILHKILTAFNMILPHFGGVRGGCLSFGGVRGYFTPLPLMGKGLGIGAVLLFTLILTACGPASDRCALDGRFLKMNQGEFWVYCFNGDLEKVDTIRVQGGRFEYEMPCHEEGILVVVLPNYTELPVFVKPGKTITLRADATSIKDIEITGTEANELMTEWRKESFSLNEKAQQKAAETFIREHATSVVSQWMLYKYFIKKADTDVRKVSQLVEFLRKNDANKALPPKQLAWLARVSDGFKSLSRCRVGDKLPAFTATDIYGKSVSSADFMKGYTVITLWSTLNYESQDMNRALKNLMQKKEDGDGNVKIDHVLSIAIDPSAKEVRDWMHRDSLPWHVVCDQRMWESPLVDKLALSYLPDNILVKDGRIVDRHTKLNDLEKKMK